MRTALALAAALLMAGGCAKLPLDNSAPGAPLLDSDGTLTGGGLPVQVLVDDPDGDRVALHFVATSTLGQTVDFSWTSFVPSGQEAVFYLSLAPGSWTLAARAKDEWEELSPAGVVSLVVAYP